MINTLLTIINLFQQFSTFLAIFIMYIHNTRRYHLDTKCKGQRTYQAGFPLFSNWCGRAEVLDILYV